MPRLCGNRVGATGLSVGGEILIYAAAHSDAFKAIVSEGDAKIGQTPVFFIYCEHGQGGAETGPNNGFYAAAQEPMQIWEVPDGQHIAGITTRPEEYERRVIGFFDDALLDAN